MLLFSFFLLNKTNVVLIVFSLLFPPVRVRFVVIKYLDFIMEYSAVKVARVSSSEPFKIAKIMCVCVAVHVQYRLQREKSVQPVVLISVCSVA